MCQYDYYCFFHFSMFVGITFEKKVLLREFKSRNIIFFYTKTIVEATKGLMTENLCTSNTCIFCKAVIVFVHCYDWQRRI